MSHQDLAAAPGPAGPGPEAIRRALRGPPGRVAVRLAAPGSPARRRVAIALLEQAGRARGGVVLETAAGDLLLTEADAAAAAQACALLAPLMGAAPAVLPLPEAGPALSDLPGPVPAALRMEAPSAAGIEALADAAPWPAVLRREGVLRLAPGEPRRLALLRLRVDAEALALHLGAAAAEADLLRHARDRLSARLLAALADPARRDALLGGTPPAPLLLDLPLAMLPDPAASAAEEPAGATALLAAIPLAEAMAEGLAERAGALRRAGWGLAVRGLDAAALAIIAPEALPGDVLLLRWSPAMTSRGATAALRRLDPARLVLTGCDGEAALEWGLALGVARFAGPGIAALMAASRMAACPHAAACTRAACMARAAAAAPEGRAGCRAPGLLAGFLPQGAAA